MDSSMLRAASTSAASKASVRPWLLCSRQYPAEGRVGSWGGKSCYRRAASRGSPSKTSRQVAGSGHAAAAAALEASPAAPESAQPEGQQAAQAAEQESLTLLEWPALCRQVACFTQTSIGAETALTCRLPIGRDQAESERLLQQTHEAQQANLTFKGTFDIRRALDAAQAGLVLHPLVLGAVGLTLEAAQRVDAQLRQGGNGSGGGFPALLELAEGLEGGAEAVQEAIFQCIQVEDGRILDAASERLAVTRAERRQNMQELRRAMDEWARLLHSKGVSERPQVVIRRDRLCIPVKAGRQGELPKGSLMLATSASGSTLYMEPEPAVALNNREMALAGAEQEEEERVLAALSSLVSSHVEPIQRMLAALTSLDLATARARHAAWLGARRPAFITPEQARSAGLVSIPRAWHPLLLQPCLPPPPSPPTIDHQPVAPSGLSSSDASDSDSESPSAGISLVPELVSEAGMKVPVSAVPTKSRGRQAGRQAGGQQAQQQQEEEAHPLPVPTDLRIPAGVGVVAVTGPNTGGKTASLKALGLLSLMAKAGCFIPQAPLGRAGQEEGQQGQQGGQPQLVWFDKVLADLGDGQSLQQSLSTFSGHVRRIRNILAAVTSRSLVLLDEVGSGTDPTEGAALASSLLERLHSSAALTYATTHHAELKELASSTPGFVNASVEFDVATLRPTYRLQWGTAGESNALAVAEGLGFSAAVVAQARQVAARLHAAKNVSQRAQLLQRSLTDEVQQAEQDAEQAAAVKRTAEKRLAGARKEVQGLEHEAHALAKGKDQEASALEQSKSELAAALAAARSGQLSVTEVEQVLRQVEQRVTAAKQESLALVGLKVASKAGLDVADWQGESAAGSKQPKKGWTPRQGEVVRVVKMGGAPGTVVAVPQGQGSGRKVSVRVGSLTMEMRLADLLPMAAGGGSAGKAQPAASGRSGGADQEAVASRAEARRAKEKLRAEGVLEAGGEQSSSSSSSGPGLAVAIQTSRNTVDVRGKVGDEAVSEVEAALNVARPGSAVFVIHGVGTGRVRTAVRDALKRNKLVQRWEEQAESLGGCTIVYIKP